MSGEVWVLLGSEKRRNKLVVSCLGGKREDADAGPEHTAWREFWEESGKVIRNAAVTNGVLLYAESKHLEIFFET